MLYDATNVSFSKLIKEKIIISPEYVEKLDFSS